MQRMKNRWKLIPDKPRRILTLILGMLLIVTAGLIGWLPGPGGTILFLLGIAVLATEFAWAERLRDRIFAWLKAIGDHIRTNPYTSAVLIVGICVVAGLCAYAFYTHIL